MPPKYVKKDPISHILDRPDTWVGSIRSRQVTDFVVIDEDFHIAKKKIEISPAIVRMFIEPLSNIIDNVARSKAGKNKTTKIIINVDEEEGTISFWNDGEVIPIEMNEKEKCYNHTLVFGHLLTGSNYDDTEEREDISGRNGIGTKVVVVFSSWFTVEGLDPHNGKLFTQTWTNNMRTAGEPKITSTKLKRGYTKVTHKLDFARFGLEGYTPDIVSLYKRYAVDCAMITKVPVVFNGVDIPVTSLLDYAKRYTSEEIDDILEIKTSDCDVVLTPASDFEAISFANGIHTPLGGVHVDAWTEAIFRPLVQKLNGKKTGKTATPQLNISEVKKFFRLFVVATVKKPEFDSQSKFRLEAPTVKASVSKVHLDKIKKWTVMNQLEDVLKAKEMLVLKKSERKKRTYEKVEKLEPANNEGGAKGHQCTLILVEGDSAKTYATTGIQKGVFGKTGRDWFGILPLRGKVLNCREAKPTAIAKNKVVSNILKSLGLQFGVDYSLDENWKKLRYGRALLLTDADVDGFHISSLLQNLFYTLFPSLFKRDPPFLTSMQTPIVRVFLPQGDRLFYNEHEYRKYVASIKGKIDKRYYKGLGTSTDEDILETFGQKLVLFSEDEKTSETFSKAFGKKFANTRKTWMENYDPEKTVLKWNGETEETLNISCSEYIDTELIKFSIDDCKRSIPNIMDGLKEGQRKIVYVAFKTKLRHTGKPLKVAQFGGDVAKRSAYHHGEQNLYDTLIGMAGAYVGSNNIPLFTRDGNFGTRVEGGKDASSARYIETRLDALTRLIYRPEDDPLLTYQEDDGDKVEPEFYVPIIPMILVNGSVGIGTGWSTNIPCFDPEDLVARIKIWLENDGVIYNEDGECIFPDIKPWYRGYKGEIVKDIDKKKNRFVTWGIAENLKNKVHVTELPVGMWTSSFVDKLETMKEEKTIKNYKNHSTNKTVDFTITETEDGQECTAENLGLYDYISLTNMVVFTEECRLKRFNTVEEIIDTYCGVRLEYYVRRKKNQLLELERKIKFLGNKKRFLEEVRDGEIKLFEMVGKKRQSRKTADVVAELEERGYDKDEEEKDEEKGDEEEDGEEKEDEGKKGKKGKKKTGYEYLLRLQISSITAEKIDKLANDIASTIEQRDELEATEEKDIWIRDLDELMAEYKKWVVNVDKEGGKGRKKKDKK